MQSTARTSDPYFARANPGGKPIRQSLIASTDSIAVLNRADFLKKRKGLAEANEHAAGGLTSFGQAEERMLKWIDTNPVINASIREYRRHCLWRRLSLRC